MPNATKLLRLSKTRTWKNKQSTRDVSYKLSSRLP